MAKHSIVLKNYLNIRNEYDAAAAITPGELLELTAAGKVQAHASAGGNAPRMFAFEDELQGKDIDEDYAADKPVQVWHPVPGDEVLAILADGEDVSIGDLLESNGDGTLRKHEAGSAGVVEYPEAIVAQALEAKDLSGSSGEESSGALGYDKRIEVRVL